MKTVRKRREKDYDTRIHDKIRKQIISQVTNQKK